MAKIKGILEKLNKKQLEVINKEIKTLYNNKTIIKELHKYLILNYRKYRDAYVENIAMDKSNASFEDGNAWGIKDNKSILRDKNEIIFNMEEEIKMLKEKIENMVEQPEDVKKQKIETQLIKVELSEKAKDVFVKIDRLNEMLMDEKKLHQESTIQFEKKIVELNQIISNLETRQTVTEDKNVTSVDAMKSERSLFDLENEMNDLKAGMKKSHQKIFFLEKENRHKEMEMAEIIKTNKMLEKRLEETANNLKTLTGEDFLLEEIKSVSESFENLSKHNTKLNEQISFLNKKNRDLETKVVETQSKARNAEKTMEMTEKMLKRVNDIFDENENRKLKHIEKYGTIEEELKTKQEKIKEMGFTLKTIKKELQKVEEQKEEKIKTIYKQIEEIKLLNDKNTEEEKKNILLQTAVDTYEKSLKENTTVVDLHRKISILNEYVYCALCKSNIKTHVVSQCMHCFCLDCLEHRLKTRSRSCPKCNQEFSRNDIKRVYF